MNQIRKGPLSLLEFFLSSGSLVLQMLELCRNLLSPRYGLRPLARRRFADGFVGAVVFGAELVHLRYQRPAPRVQLEEGVQVDVRPSKPVCVLYEIRVRAQQAQVYRYPLTLCLEPRASAIACCSSIDRLCSDAPP